MHKGLEIYKDVIKTFFLLLCITIRQNKEIGIAIMISTSTHVSHNNNLHDYYSMQLY